MEKRTYKINVRDGSHLNMADAEAAVRDYGPYKLGLYVEYGHITSVLWAQYIGLMVTKTAPITGPLLAGYEWAGDCVIPSLSGNVLPYFPDHGEITVHDVSPLFPASVVSGDAPVGAINADVEMRWDTVLGYQVFGILSAPVERGTVVDSKGVVDSIMPDFEGEGVSRDSRWYIRRTPMMSVALETRVDRAVAKWI